MQQLVLDIGPAFEPDFDNFVAGPNAEAVAAVRDFAAGATREAVLYLWGEPGSGRTHLLNAASRANARSACASNDPLRVIPPIELSLRAPASVPARD